MASQGYKFYFYEYPDFVPEGQTQRSAEITSAFSCRYVKFTGLAESGEIKNIYTEDYAEQSQLRLYLPEQPAHAPTDCALTLLFAQHDFPSTSTPTRAEQQLYQWLKGRKWEYHDTFRNLYATLVLKKAPKCVAERLYGVDAYREVEYTFTNILGYPYTSPKVTPSNIL